MAVDVTAAVVASAEVVAMQDDDGDDDDQDHDHESCWCLVW